MQYDPLGHQPERSLAGTGEMLSDLSSSSQPQTPSLGEGQFDHGVFGIEFRQIGRRSFRDAG